MSIGDRIKFLRQRKEMTQKELGLLVGFSEKTADVRIAHYEMNLKKPRDKILKAIADALEVNIKALIAPDISNDVAIMHTLFLLEDELGFFIDKEFGRYRIELNARHPRHDEIEILLAEWYEYYMKYQQSGFNPAEYDNWRYQYPSYTPEFQEEEDFRRFIKRKDDLTSWPLMCSCKEVPSEGNFRVGSWYHGKMITESKCQEYRGKIVDEGFLVLDIECVPYYFPMQTFATCFKIL